MRSAVVVESARSPIGRAFKGSLADVRPDDLLVSVVQSLTNSLPPEVSDSIEDLIVGCGSPGGEQGFNIARVASILLGWDHVPGVTVNRYCASSVEATRMAANSIRVGENKLLISAGVESCSSYAKGEADSIPDTMNPEFDLARGRTELRSIGSIRGWSDPRLTNELPDIYIGMGETAENVAEVRGISRREQDEYALLSQSRTREAIERGFWSGDITPFVKRDGTLVSSDDSPRLGTTLEGLSSLNPAFREHGSVTAGNSCPLSDGASALLVGEEDFVRSIGLIPKVRILGTAVSALSPEIMGLGPVGAIRAVLQQTGRSLGDIDLIEINEAFASQVVACARELDISFDKLNVNGGAISVGHPFGSTGARIIHSLTRALEERDLSTGLVSMCVAGGQGMAMVIERI